MTKSEQFADCQGLERASAQGTLAVSREYTELATAALGLHTLLVRKMSAVMRYIQARFPDTTFAMKPSSDLLEGMFYLVIYPGENREAIKALVSWSDRELNDFFSWRLAFPEEEV